MKIKHINLLVLKPLFLCFALLQTVSCWDGLNDMLEEGGSPSAIIFTQSSLTSGGMTINWTDPASVTGYDHILVIYTPGDSVTLNKGVTIFNISGLSSSTEYTVTVQAIGKENIVKAQSSFKVTPSNTYILSFVYNAGDLNNIRFPYLGYYYILMNDINLNSYANWEPIGTSGTPFSGIFEGQGHNISKLTVNSASKPIGLFGYISAGTVKNTRVSGTVQGTTDDSQIGGLVGYNNGGVIKNSSASVAVSGTATTFGSSIGVIAGYNTGSISYCSAAGTAFESRVATTALSSQFNIGGVAGYNTGNITYCSSSATVTADQNSTGLGGLAGLSSGLISRCYSIGAVTGGFNYIGGFVGMINDGSVSNCYAFGKVSGGTLDTGGFVGLHYSGTVQNCYAIGSVGGSGNVGGFSGLTNTGTYTACYYNSQTTGQSDDTGKGFPRTTNQMKLADTYSGWDFTAVWGISSGINGGYPYLRDVAP